MWHWGKTPADNRPAKAKEPLRASAGSTASAGGTAPDLRCPLCGKSFHSDDAAQCQTCPLAVKCGLVMCPNCSYEFAP